MSDILPVSAPKTPLPKGAWDCHAHIFGPFDRYPLAKNPPYQPPVASRAQFLAMLDTVGFDHGVVVHGSANGWDNSATSDAAQEEARLKAVCVVPTDIAQADLEHMNAAGIRGVRITPALPGASGLPGMLSLDDIPAIAARIKPLGWHLNIWAPQDLVRAHWDRLVSLDMPVVFDHMGFIQTDKGVDHADFDWFLSGLRDTGFHVKLGPGRVSKAFPDFADVRPFFDALAAAVPDQLLFSSDWPYLGLDMRVWNPGHMVDLFDSWSTDNTLRQQVFVTNPGRFYAPE